MSDLQQLPAEVLETQSTEEHSSQQLLDKYIFELQQHQQQQQQQQLPHNQQQSHFSLDDQWDESFEDLFPDLI